MKFDTTLPPPEDRVPPTRAAGTPGGPGAPRLAPGMQLGPYLIEAEVARGGQGAVYRATHTTLKTPVALKVMLRGDPRSLGRFTQEAQVLARLKHPGLPRVTDLGQIEGVPYLAMDLVRGQDLSAWVATHGLPDPDWIVDVLGQVARTVEYCHQQGVVHRDLKPANVILEEESGRPILVDFGLIQRRVSAGALQTLQDSGQLTNEGETPGTPSYMAPEQADPTFGDVGPGADIYALGGTLFFLLTGHAPFEGPTAYNVITRLLKDPAPDPRDLEARTPAGLAGLCRGALAKTPPERPVTAVAFAEELEEALHHAPKRGRLLTALAGGAALLLAGATYATTGSAPADPEPAPQPAEKTPAAPARKTIVQEPTPRWPTGIKTASVLVRITDQTSPRGFSLRGMTLKVLQDRREVADFTFPQDHSVAGTNPPRLYDKAISRLSSLRPGFGELRVRMTWKIHYAWISGAARTLPIVRREFRIPYRPGTRQLKRTLDVRGECGRHRETVEYAYEMKLEVTIELE